MKTILVFMCMLINALPSFCQTDKHELSMTAGIGSGPFIIESLKRLDFFSTEYRQDQIAPVIAVAYYYRLSQKTRLGSEIIFDRFWIDDRKNSYRFNSFLCQIHYIWLDKKKISLYSGLAAGITFKNAEETLNGALKSSKKTYPGMHLYLIGFDYKLKSLSITINNGIGVSGVINLGMKYRF